MKKITKFKRSIRAVSPVISVLLMIAIAVVASIFAYAWVTGYIGSKTDQAGKSILIQSFTSQGNLVIYVQNTGQGVMHLKHDSCVYVNDILKNILLVDENDASTGQLDPIPITESQMLALTIDYQPLPNEHLRIKIVIVEGTFIETSGNSGSQANTVAVTFNKDPATAASTTSPFGNQQYYIGSVMVLSATQASGEALTSWTSSSTIKLYNDQATPALAKINAAGTITAHFASSTQSRLEFASGANQIIAIDQMSQLITIKRVQDTSGPITVNLIASFGSGLFYSTSGTQIQTFDIANQGGQASFYFKDSVAGQNKLTISATGYASDVTTFTITSSQNPSPSASTSPTTNPSGNPTPSATPITSPSASPSPTPATTPTTSPSPSLSPTPNPTLGNVQVTFVVNPVGSGTSTPTGTQTYIYGQTVNIQASANSGFTFSSWTRTGVIEITSTTSATTTATMLSDGTITANYVSSASNKLAFTAGTNQILAKNVGSAAITVQRQSSSNSQLTSGTTTVNLETTSNGGTFTNSAGTQISSITINSGQSSATFYYKDSTTGTPTITASATSFASVQTVFSVNLCYSNFDGANWLSGWTTGTQPPWYQSAFGEGFGATSAAKSDSTSYLGGNDGPFTCSVLDTSLGNTITVTFNYKLENTDNANDLRIAWTSAANPNLGTNSPDFHYVSNIGLPGNNGWNSYTLTFTKTANPTAFTTHFMFRFESSLQTHQGSGLIESAWVDNALIRVT